MGIWNEMHVLWLFLNDRTYICTNDVNVIPILYLCRHKLCIKLASLCLCRHMRYLTRKWATAKASVLYPQHCFSTFAFNKLISYSLVIWVLSHFSMKFASIFKICVIFQSVLHVNMYVWPSLLTIWASYSAFDVFLGIMLDGHMLPARIYCEISHHFTIL
jgi:hypothetical protein